MSQLRVFETHPYVNQYIILYTDIPQLADVSLWLDFSHSQFGGFVSEANIKSMNIRVDRWKRETFDGVKPSCIKNSF